MLFVALSLLVAGEDNSLTCLRHHYSNHSRVVVRDTVYEGCSDHEFGGAICIDKEETIFELSNCRFLRCHSDQLGGAIEFFGDSFSFFHFAGLSCSSDTRAFCCCWAFAKTSPLNSMNQSSGTLGWADQDSFGFNTRQTPQWFKGILFDLNTTFNHVVDCCSSFTSVGYTPYTVSYARVYSNAQGGVIVVQVIHRDPYLIKCVEFYNNSVKLETTNPGIIWSNIPVTCENSVFLSNKAEFLIGTNQGYGPRAMNFVKCVFDKTIITGVANADIITSGCESRARGDVPWKYAECQRVFLELGSQGREKSL
jgi:hypothetical protein